MVLKGLTFKSLKKHPALMPLFFCVGCGVVGAGFYLARLALRSPEVSWDKKNNPYPWQKLGATYQHKFYSPKRDYSKLKYPSERPDLDEE